MMTFEAYCDGASRKDGRGGWGLLLLTLQGFKKVREDAFYGGAFDTTNNRMELQGAIEALKAVPEWSHITVYSDSAYVILGITDYLDVWLQAGWRTSTNKPVKNRDLWEELGWLDVNRSVTWKKVKGHSGNPGNERADELAAMGVPNAKSK